MGRFFSSKDSNTSEHRVGKSSGTRAKNRRAKPALEALEPRILLSATWTGTAGDDVFTGNGGADDAHGLSGADQLDGGGGDDLLFGGTGNDILHGDAGEDTLTSGGGNDTMDGGTGNDTFDLAGVLNGDVVTIDGGANSDTIDLSGFNLDKATFSNGSLVLDMGGGQSFTINYSNVETIQFGDINASVLAGNHTGNEFSGSTVFIDGGQAFKIEMTGGGTVDFSYDTSTDTVTVSDIDGTGAGSALNISDLNGTDLAIDSMTFDSEIGTIDSNMTIGNLDFGDKSIDTATTINANVTTIGNIKGIKSGGSLSITGDVGTLTIGGKLIGTVDVVGDLNSMIVQDVLETTGDIDVSGTMGTIRFDKEVLGDLTFQGDVGTLDINDTLEGTITVAGDLDSVTNDGELKSSITATNVSGAFSLIDNKNSYSYSNTFGSTTQVIYDGSTVSTQASPNISPTAANDTVTVSEDTAATTGNVLTNDTDPDNDTLSVTGFTQATNGSVVDNGNGTFGYTPNANFNGNDSFTYTISDGNGGTDTATVDVTVSSVNDAPVAVNDTVTTNEDTAVTTGNVLTNDTDTDNDTLSVTGFSQATNGSVVDNGNGTFGYTPNENLNGSDSFTYTLSDGNGGTSTGTVNVTVIGVNDGPVAAADAASTNQDTAVTTANVLANDTDADNDTLSVNTFTQAANGTVADNGNGTFTYTPSANFSGTDSFTYTVSDGNGGTSTTTVNLTIAAAAAPSEPTKELRTEEPISDQHPVQSTAPTSVIGPGEPIRESTGIADPVSVLSPVKSGEFRDGGDARTESFDPPVDSRVSMDSEREMLVTAPGELREGDTSAAATDAVSSAGGGNISGSSYDDTIGLVDALAARDERDIASEIRNNDASPVEYPTGDALTRTEVVSAVGDLRGGSFVSTEADESEAGRIVPELAGGVERTGTAMDAFVIGEELGLNELARTRSLGVDGTQLLGAGGNDKAADSIAYEQNNISDRGTSGFLALLWASVRGMAGAGRASEDVDSRASRTASERSCSKSANSRTGGAKEPESLWSGFDE